MASSTHQIFPEQDYRPLRKAFVDELLSIADTYPDVIVLDADLSRSTGTDEWQREYPNRFYNMGISEQNMIGVASGLCDLDYIPFATTYAIFLGRAFDQIRQSVSYSKKNVKIVCSHAGLAASYDGGSHQGLEDIALMRMLPGMHVFTPVDYNEARKVVRYCAELPKPCYVRLQKEPTANFTSASGDFDIHNIHVVGKNERIALVGVGSMMARCIEAQSRLNELEVATKVIGISTVQPLNGQKLIEEIGGCDHVFCVEEHMRRGGVSEALAALLIGRFGGKLHSLAMESFGETGSWKQLLTKYGLMPEGITDRVMRALNQT